jgi:hypothetical protein
MVKKNLKTDNCKLAALDRRAAPFHLSHEHVQMARELGMNPKKLGKLDNHDQEPWKLPLPDFIRKLYSRRFGKGMPDAVRSIEETAAAKHAKKRAKKVTCEGARRMVDERDDPLSKCR